MSTGEGLAPGSMTKETMTFLLQQEDLASNLDLLDSSILSAGELELAREFMPHWKITTEISDKAVTKTMRRYIVDCSWDNNQLEGFFSDRVDGDVHDDVIEFLRNTIGDEKITGGRTDCVVGGRYPEHELRFFLVAGPTTLGDIKRAMVAESYLRDAGFDTISQESPSY